MSNLQKNVRFLFVASRLKTHQEFADLFGLNLYDISRVINDAPGRRPDRVLWAIADHYEIDPTDLDLPPTKFKKLFPGSELTFAAFRASQQNAKQWRDAAEEYKGEYKTYHRAANGEDFIVSLLSIRHATKDGIKIELINPYLGIDPEYSAYEYSGYMYPINNLLYCVLEQKNDASDLWTLIIGEPRTPKSSRAPKTKKVLRGVMTGIGVEAEKSYIAADAFISIKLERKLGDWQKALGKELRYTTEVPNRVKTELGRDRVKFAF